MFRTILLEKQNKNFFLGKKLTGGRSHIACMHGSVLTTAETANKITQYSNKSPLLSCWPISDPEVGQFRSIFVSEEEQITCYVLPNREDFCLCLVLSSEELIQRSKVTLNCLMLTFVFCNDSFLSSESKIKEYWKLRGEMQKQIHPLCTGTGNYSYHGEKAAAFVHFIACSTFE